MLNLGDLNSFGWITNGFTIILKNASKISDSGNNKRDCQFLDNFTDEKILFRGYPKRQKIMKYFHRSWRGWKLWYISLN